MNARLTRRRLLQLAATAASVLATPPAKAAQTVKPNILFIMADDLGYADLGCLGGRTAPTPHIDSLAADGLLMSQGYANSPVCSPTRLALMTGRYQYRLRAGLEEPLGAAKVGLPPTHPTLPSLLKAAGYRTALVGKWHLGLPPDFGPLKSGYDSFFGIHHGGADYFSHRLLAKEDRADGLFDGSVKVERHGYMTDLLADEAVRQIEINRRDPRPFFLSLHFTAPHWPWEGPEDARLSDAISDLRHFDGGNLATYAHMLASLDAGVGRVLAALDRAGRRKDTIVIFTSDNGGERFSDVWPFVGGKGELLEGGIRVPVLLRWPDRVRAGRRSDQVMMSMDWLPTLLAAAGAAPDPRWPSDGDNLLPVLVGEARSAPRRLFWRYKANDQAAVRDGDWKYLRIGGRKHLFDLAADQRERADLSKREPERLKRLADAHRDWAATMMPYPADSYSDDVRQHLVDRY